MSVKWVGPERWGQVVMTAVRLMRHQLPEPVVTEPPEGRPRSSGRRRERPSSPVSQVGFAPTRRPASRGGHDNDPGAATHPWPRGWPPGSRRSSQSTRCNAQGPGPPSGEAGFTGFELQALHPGLEEAGGGCGSQGRPVGPPGWGPRLSKEAAPGRSSLALSTTRSGSERTPATAAVSSGSSCAHRAAADDHRITAGAGSRVEPMARLRRGPLHPLAGGRCGRAVRFHPHSIAHLQQAQGRPSAHPVAGGPRSAAALRSAGPPLISTFNSSGPAIGRGLRRPSGIRSAIAHTTRQMPAGVSPASLQGACAVVQAGSSSPPKVFAPAGASPADPGTHLGVGRPGSWRGSLPPPACHRRARPPPPPPPAVD